MNRLAEILLNKSLDECSIEELQSITQKYPYFSAGHLLAVQKLQKKNPDQLSAPLQKANLHFRSVYINQVLAEKGNAEMIAGANSVFVKDQAEENKEEIHESEHSGQTSPDEIKDKGIVVQPESIVLYQTHY